MTTVYKALQAKKAHKQTLQSIHDQAMQEGRYDLAQKLFVKIMTLNSDIQALEQIQALQHGDLEILEEHNGGPDHDSTAD